MSTMQQLAQTYVFGNPVPAIIILAALSAWLNGSH